MWNLVNIDWSKIVAPLVTAAIASVGTWAVVAFRKSAKNLGKTEVEIDEEELVEAERAVEAAKITPDTKDDEVAKAVVEKAKRKLANAKRWQAVLDGIADAGSPNEKGDDGGRA